MPIYRVRSDHLQELPLTTFEVAGLKERTDLQRLLREQIDIIAPQTLVIAEEFSEWDNSARRIDLLGVARTGDLVVIELKRSTSGEHMELQALRYAAMVSTMTFDRAVEVYERHLARLGTDQSARDQLLKFLGWDEPDHERFAQDVTIVLASADFSQELTTTVMWLIERDVDIRCVRLRPLLDGDDVLLDVQQVIPLPEASDYQVKLREKRGEERRGNKTEEQQLDFWTGFLTVAESKTQLLSSLSPSRFSWIARGSGLGNVAYQCVIQKHRCHLELHIDRGDQQENKAIFDAFLAEKEPIERAFGADLIWDRQDANRRSLIRHIVMDAGLADADRWPEIHERMSDALIRFDRALRPHIERVKAQKRGLSDVSSLAPD